MPHRDNNHHSRWKLTREKILMFAGLGVIFFETVVATIGLHFYFEVLLAGLALCGVSITQWTDRR